MNVYIRYDFEFISLWTICFKFSCFCSTRRPAQTVFSKFWSYLELINFCKPLYRFDCPNLFQKCLPPGVVSRHKMPIGCLNLSAKLIDGFTPRGVPSFVFSKTSKTLVTLAFSNSTWTILAPGWSLLSSLCLTVFKILSVKVGFFSVHFYDRAQLFSWLLSVNDQSLRKCGVNFGVYSNVFSGFQNCSTLSAS